MKMKAIKDLCKLSATAFVYEVAVGIEHLYKHVTRLFSEADTIRDNAPHSRQIIKTLASEECSKILILLDALRINRHELSSRGRQLGYFNDHLAKGIYVKYCWTRPAWFSNVRDFAQRERREFYLDGPNDYDWVFRNEILRKREERIYVDYRETDDGHTWWVPDIVSLVDGLLRPFRLHVEPAIWRLVQALESVGMLQESALGEVQEYWQQVSISDATHWQEIRAHNQRTLAILNGKGLMRDQRFANTVVDNWLFPLYLLELGLIKNDLRDIPVPEIE